MPVAAEADALIISQTKASVAFITMNSPESRNALSRNMLVKLRNAINAANEDAGVRVIVLHGAGGKSFASGADVREFGDTRESYETFRSFIEDVYSVIGTVRKPIVAAIEGACVGGGLALAIRCDIRIAGQGARFVLPPARMGLAYSHAALAELVALVGPSVAKDMLFSARSVQADEALRTGLVNYVVPDAAVLEYATEYARKVASNAPLTMAAAKASIQELLAAKPANELSEQLATQCLDSEDFQEGRRAFLEKRAPNFRGL